MSSAAWNREHNRRKREARKLLPTHLVVGQVNSVDLYQRSPLWCGVERGGPVKVAHARGLTTCKECAARFDAALPRLKEHSAKVWAAKLSTKGK